MPKFKKRSTLAFLLLALLALAVLWPIGKLVKGSGGLKSARGRINILLLGIPGGDYPGATLTDSLVLVSLNPQKADVATISIPRDIWVASLSDKINSTYAYGEAKKQGGGLILAKAAVEEILATPVHYGVVMDFEGFKKAVDLIGGVDVFVETTFDDFRYPIAGKENDECGGDPEYRCRYEHLRFERGWQHMDGELALKFARSRYATNSGEGTDFARSKRQQKVILAFYKKALSLKNMFDLGKVLGFWDVFKEHIQTDIAPADFPIFYELVTKIDWGKVRSFTLDYGEKNEGGLLFNPPVEEYGAWVLVPRSGDWREIQEKVREFLEL